MSSKIVLLFTTFVIMASFGMMAIPTASALNPNPVDNSHVTARFESEHKICGNHLCAPGERTSWEKAVWDHQTVSQGKITHVSQHGEDVMHKMSGSTPGSTTSHGSEKPIVHSTMPVINATKSDHMTGMPNTK